MPRIMIVDDDVTIQMELEEYLGHMNHTIVGIADTGIEAVETARQMKPDLILMDINMPGEMDGISAARKIKEEMDAGVVFVTGFDDPEYIERAKLVEPFGYIMKPFDEREINGVIEIALHKRKLELELKSAHERLGEGNFLLQGEIAERKRLEETQNQTLSQLQATLEATVDGIIVVGLDSKISTSSSRFKKIWHMPDSILESKKADKALDFVLTQLTKPETFSKRVLSAFSDPHSNTSDTLYLKDGRIVETYSRPQKLDGKIIGRVWAFRDVTEPERARMELKASRDRLQALSDASFESVFFSDQGICIDQNSAAERMFGYTHEEAIGRSGMEWIAPEDSEKVRNKMMSGYEKHYEVTAIRKDGSTFPAEIQGRMFNYMGKPIRVTALRDITVQKRLEDQLRHAQKMASISTFTGGIAHDYNNLLSIIMGNLSLAMEATTPGSHLTDFLNEADMAARKTRDLTHELMSLSHGGNPVKALGSLKELLNIAIDAIPAHSSISLKKSIARDLWPVPYDPYKMPAVFRNIVTNAVEAMSHKGTLTISATNFPFEDNDRYTALPLKRGDYVHITIQDEGIGIPEQHMARIFDPYFSTKAMGVQKGMGLSLATTYSIIQKHGGHIAINSSPGVGTTVNIYLPAGSQQVKTDAPVPSHKISTSPLKRVLLMDDEKMLQTLARKILKQLGYAAVTVNDGAEAVAEYKKHHGSDEPFDVVILDLTIKGGMGGEQTILELQKIDPNVKAVVSSGYSNDPIMTDFEAYGFQRALPKPYRKEDLKKALAEI